MLLVLSLVAALAPAQSTEFFIVKSENMSPRLNINQRVEFDMPPTPRGRQGRRHRHPAPTGGRP